MKGKSITLSPARRFICDLLWASKRIPTVPVQRRMRLRATVEMRARLADRPSWAAIFARAFAVVASEFPELRRTFIGWPWAHLYEYPVSTAVVAVEREFEGEKVVLVGDIKDPASKPLGELASAMRGFATVPVTSLKRFRPILWVSRLPLFVRRPLWWIGLNMGRQRINYFGTFAVTSYGRWGAESLHPLTPTTARLTYGVIDASGEVNVRIIYDHRVLDGATVARALCRLEKLLQGQMQQELADLVRECGSGATGDAVQCK